MVEHALKYASWGWYVFPTHYIIDGKCSCRKETCKSPGKHPIYSLAPHGFQDASIEPSMIKLWWHKSPKAYISVATGRISKIFVFDIDKKNDGLDTLSDFEKEHGQATPEGYEGRVMTGGGGYHFYYNYPDNIKNLPKKLILKSYSNKTGFCPGFDIRCDGGYAVLPPSNHISGRNYEWEV